jgi:hypothetical protein
MASGTNSSSKGFDFASDDILELSNGNHSDPSIGVNPAKETKTVSEDKSNVCATEVINDAVKGNVNFFTEEAIAKITEELTKFMTEDPSKALISLLSQLKLNGFDVSADD